jgi:uncharacterized protein (TIGR02147 family)
LNIYQDIDYRRILKKSVLERKRDDARVNFQRLAQYARIPKSYLSKVVHGDADLTQDQLYLVNKFLGFTPEESEYMRLLLELARCSLAERKRELRQQIERRQSENLETKAHIRASLPPIEMSALSEYYLDPHMQIIHICLLIERYASDLKALARDLRIHISRVTHIVARLEKLGVVERDERDRVKVLVTSIHLPKESLLFDPWRNQIRLASLKQMEALPRDEIYSFSVTFSATPEIRWLIQSRFLEYIGNLEGAVAAAPSHQAYQLNFDLFPWSCPT